MRAIAILAATLAAPACFGQTADDFFRSAGAVFRYTDEEQRLYWAPHIEHSHRRILEAADLAAGRSVATVLGAGSCAEIPLAELAERFERVVLVDMDGASMVRAVEPLPVELRSKIELRVTDVTTFAATLMDRLAAAVEASEAPEAALQGIRQAFDAVDGGAQPVRLPRSDLVVSSLVLSELDRYPLTFTDRLLRARYGVRLESWTGYAEARDRLRRLTIADHVQLLASLCRPDGAIYYGDTVARGPAYAQFDPALRAAAENAAFTDFERLGLVKTRAAMRAVVGALCRAEHPVETEVAAFERLLEAYERMAADTFEPLVDLDEARRQWAVHGLQPRGEPTSWWWLEYPCAIVHSAGGFRVRSWILRPAGSAGRPGSS